MLLPSCRLLTVPSGWVPEVFLVLGPQKRLPGTEMPVEEAAILETIAPPKNFSGNIWVSWTD